MIVCSCNVLSDYEIRNVVAAAREQPLNANLNANEVYRRLGCSMRCGRCAPANRMGLLHGERRATLWSGSRQEFRNIIAARCDFYQNELSCRPSSPECCPPDPAAHPWFGPRKERTERLPSQSWWTQPSTSGNLTFDEYRAETLRRRLWRGRGRDE